MICQQTAKLSILFNQHNSMTDLIQRELRNLNTLTAWPINWPDLSHLLQLVLPQLDMVHFHTQRSYDMFVTNSTAFSHIISYHLISSHSISYHLISSHIISYHLIASRIISYHRLISLDSSSLAITATEDGSPNSSSVFLKKKNRGSSVFYI